MDFSAITQLRLKQAFYNVSHFQNINENTDFLNVLFECSSRHMLFIHDDVSRGHCVYLTDTNGIGIDKVFTLHNPEHKHIFLWHIDGVLYPKDSKCDSAFLSKDTIGFIEFKTNAVNKTLNAIEENYKKASEQLRLSIEDISSRCASVGIEIRSIVEIKAFAVFNPTVPKHNAHMTSAMIRFLRQTKGIKLHFVNCHRL